MGMSNHLKLLGTSAAALAAFTLLASPASFAQRPGPPPGPPGANRPGDRDDYWRGEDWRRGNWRKDTAYFQRAQETCSKMAIQDVWRQGGYSAQYEVGPKLIEGRRGPELRGSMRVHDRRGLRFSPTVCELGRGGEARDIDWK
ncbi:MAG: hypothetical protein ABI740_09880 [Alphaproteobacteria bacterium]